MNLEPSFTVEGLALLAAVILPGLVSVSVYRLLVGGRDLDWSSAAAIGFFYTALTYALFLPLTLYLADTANLAANRNSYWAALLFLELVAPVLLPVAWWWLRERPFLQAILLAQHHTAFDYYFRRRQAVFMIVHLKDGRAIGGYWGPGSYGSVTPRSGDLYISAVYQLDAERKFGSPVVSTDGLLIRREEYSFLELFRPTQEGVE